MLTAIILICIFLLLTLLLLCRIRASFTFTHLGKENQSDIVIKYLFLKVRLPVKKDIEKRAKEIAKKDDESPAEKGIGYYYSIYKVLKKDILDIFDYVRGHAVSIEDVSFKLDFGFSDAAQTGIMTGVFNGAVYNFFAYLDSSLKLEHWDVKISPDFKEEKFDVYLTCIASTKMAHIIRVVLWGVKLLIKKRRAEKKGMR